MASWSVAADTAHGDASHSGLHYATCIIVGELKQELLQK